MVILPVRVLRSDENIYLVAMGCLKLSFRETGERQIFLSVWRRGAPKKIDHRNFLPLGEKKAGKENCDNYYPFGLTFNSYQRENAVKNQYLYNNGAERQDELDLNVDATKFRMYDPAMGRWWQIDPKVDEFYGWTSYNYSLDNPVRYNDPNGDCPPGVNCNNPLPQMEVRRNRASNLGPGDVRNGGTRFHAGHDLHATTGTNVSSTLPGTVVSATNAGNNSYGNTVVVKSNIHPEAQPGFVGPPSALPAPSGVPEKNIYVQYSHLESMNVSQGDNVTRGQTVGTVGTTGNATTDNPLDVHLHINVGTSVTASGTSIPNNATVSPNLVYNNVSFASANPAGNQSTTGIVRTTTNAQGVQTSTTLQPILPPPPQPNNNANGTRPRQ